MAEGQKLAAQEADLGRASAYRTGTGWPGSRDTSGDRGSDGGGTANGTGTGWPTDRSGSGDSRGSGDQSDTGSGGGSDGAAGNDSGGSGDDGDGGTPVDRENRLTEPTGEAGGEPTGHPARIKPKDDERTQRSLEMENSAAVRLADAGYRIEQNPSAPDVAQARQDHGDFGFPRKNPDYLIEGRVFDAYSPTSPNKPVHSLALEVASKINAGQTQRVVVNLEDWRGDVDALRRYFHDSPVPNLKELKIITPAGEIMQFVPE